jgi:hypothetical protein
MENEGDQGKGKEAAKSAVMVSGGMHAPRKTSVCEGRL